MPQLVFRYGDGGEDQVFDLRDDQIGIGREADNPIVIDSTYVSQHHARLNRGEDGSYTLYDLGSNNGTYVNDRAVTTVQLKHGDQIKFGVCEVDFIDAPEEELPVEVDRTQRLTLDDVSQSSAQYWGAAVENKRRELEELERRIEELEANRDGVSASGATPEAADRRDSEGRRDELSEEIAKLEARHENIQQQLLDQTTKLESVTQHEIPAAEAELEEVRKEIAAAQAQLASAQEQVRQIENLEEETRKLKSTIEGLYSEHDMKKVSLQHTVDEFLRTEAKLDEVKAVAGEAEERAANAEARTQNALDQHKQLVEKNNTILASMKEAEAELNEISKRIHEESGRKRELMAENQKAKGELSDLHEQIEMADAKLTGKIDDWDDFEKQALERVVEKKREVEQVCHQTEKRLESAKDELIEVRSRIKQETEDAQRNLDDLRMNHYEPTKELHEELTMRNEEIANEIAIRERRLEELRQLIFESEETEKIVSENLTHRGEELQKLEERVGDEYKRIEEEISMRRPVFDPQTRPTLPRVTPIFKPSSAPVPWQGKNGSGGALRTKLVVFDPGSGERGADFSELENAIGETPLPVGFAGLAAATRGYFESSLSGAARHNLPVLFVPGDDLEANGATLQKLRAALPNQLILLGWRRQTFMSVQATLDKGSNFQDLTALLAQSGGSVTTDPYMNTFFDSLNHGKRYLFLPHALPWNPQSPVPFAERDGIFIDAAGYEPENLMHQGLAAEMKQVIEMSRLRLTIPNVSERIVNELVEQFDLGDDWVSVIPEPEYKERLETLGNHLAMVSFEKIAFDCGALRDALLARTVLLAVGSEPLQVFYPEASNSGGDRLLPDPSRIVSMIEDPDHFARVTRQAEKNLLENYSYQAAARELDEFVGSLESLAS